jgi:hypothetical protein
MTPGAKKVLEDMAADENCDLVQAGSQAWCGPRRTSPGVVKQLLGCLAISVSWNEGRAIYYRLNETGLAILRRPELEGEIKTTVTQNKGPFSIKNDQIEYLDPVDGLG